ncbi:uncharacterized protein F4822DRAFT_409684 [Hypoxylon trugodes]|uniref:uncharacterized protein n=1 Tax=Hypoxylon trugodes TaxID=326681 RepID=UPI00219040BC|nr:uncharacterized protein F4822DRAFT_409684 [Hypoxylon trugodes]KAI1386333.1 hypothetical protein F4822DRAFT_409684 [Hypoxylon trugodes]
MSKANEGLKDPYEEMEGYVGPTHYSKPYFSNHLHETPPSHLEMLGHVNCGYLSTPFKPPTLEALKQHAQSLTYLISTIAPSTFGGEIDNANKEERETLDFFRKNEAYDWLDNLQAPYQNIDPAHHRPLNSLVNLVKSNSDENGVLWHCPLETSPESLIEAHPENIYRPFQTHLTLLMHANECLERLDHEYSAMGGLLAILPTDKEPVSKHPELDKAKETLVGQWLLYTQRLVARMHELEISYANSLDLLAGEAIVPAQHTSFHGPDGRSGREIVFPQDRWILANAGEDVFEFVHQLLDRQESDANKRDAAWAGLGLTGDSLVDGGASVRGIVSVDLSTRFYRLKGSGHGPVFVLPGFADRPSTQHTKEMENKPTVVTLTQPSDPGLYGTSAWDRRVKAKEREWQDRGFQVTELSKENRELKTSNEAQGEELTRLRHLNKVYESSYGQSEQDVAQMIADIAKERDDIRKKYDADAGIRNDLAKELARYKAAAAADQDREPAKLPEVKEGEEQIINKATYDAIQQQGQAVDIAKSNIPFAWSTLERLARENHIDLDDFSWMQAIAGLP